MNDTYIAHHGILGQKWGIRRYQNSDGSLTEAGKKHYRTNLDYQVSTTSSKKNKKLSKNGVNTTVNSVNSISRDASKINNSVQKIRKNKSNKEINEKLSKMSDEELKKRVQRLNMEKQYRDLTGSGKVLSGQDYVREVLETVGGVAGIAGSAVAIYAAIKASK